MSKYGYFAVSTGVSLQHLYEKGEFDIELLAHLDLKPDELVHIPHVQGGVIGINLEHERGAALLEKWHALTSKKEASISGYPEEIILSSLLYKLGYPPTLKNSSMWQEDTSSEKGRDPYFLLKTARPK